MITDEQRKECLLKICSKYGIDLKEDTNTKDCDFCHQPVRITHCVDVSGQTCADEGWDSPYQFYFCNLDHFKKFFIDYGKTDFADVSTDYDGDWEVCISRELINDLF